MSSHLLYQLEINPNSKSSMYYVNEKFNSFGDLLQECYKNVGKSFKENILFTIFKCDGTKRTESSILEYLYFDLDSIDKEKTNHYIETVSGYLNLDKDDLAVVNSGRGLQIFIALDKSITADEFQTIKFSYKKLAKQLEEFCLNKNLKVKFDTSIYERSRVLRIPNSINFNPAKDPVKCEASVIQPGNFNEKIALDKIYELTKFEPRKIIKNHGPVNKFKNKLCIEKMWNTPIKEGEPRHPVFFRLSMHEKLSGTSIEECEKKIKHLCKISNMDPTIRGIPQMKQAYEGPDYDHGCNDEILSKFCDKNCYLHPEKIQQRKDIMHQVDQIYDPQYGVKLLGCNQNKFFYSVKETKEIIGLKASEHTKANLTALCPWEYWTDNFGYVDKNGIPKISLDELFKAQRKIGLFSDNNIRGMGLWIDKNRIVTNFKETIVDGELKEDFPTKYFYESNRGEKISLKEQLSQKDIDDINEIFNLFGYVNETDAKYLLGSIIYFSVFNLLKWRPNIWLTGKRGSGKTKIQNWIKEKFFNYYGTYSFQDVTAAGLKQYIKSDSRLVFIDEAESNNIQSGKRLEQVIELMRQSVSGEETFSLRGTSNGDSTGGKLNSAFFLASVKPTIITSADETRFKIIELKINDKISWNDLKKKIYGLDDKISNRLLSYCINNLDEYKSILKDCYNFLTGELKIESRLADTISPFAAGYLILNPSAVKEQILSDMSGTYADDEDMNKNDALECLNIILQARTKYNQMTIEELIDGIRTGVSDNDKFDQELMRFGIRYLNDTDDIAIYSKSTEIKKLLENTPYSGRFGKILKQHDFYSNNKPVRFFGSLKWCIIIKLDTNS